MSDLLAALQAAGQVEAQGGFTIDPEKAREKLRQYQLADPHRYVLLLVETAVSCGAARIDFEIDSDDLHLRFEGASFGFAELENIYASLFASIGEVAVEELARLRGLAQLAFALNSAMALNPRFVRVVSVGADGTGARLELQVDAPDQVHVIEAKDGQAPGTWIHVKDRFRPGLVLEFFRSLRGNLAEITLLRDHCRWARTSVFVNGDLISGPVEFERDHWTAVDVFDPPDGPANERERIGRAALGLIRDNGKLAAPAVGLLSNGVLMEGVELVGGVPGFAAIVDSPRFGKDVSQTKLLRDAGYDAVMLAIRAAQDQAIARLAERCAVESGPSWGPLVLRKWLYQGEFGGLSRALGEHPVFACVADVPLWPVIGAANITTRALIESDGPIRYATESFEFAPLDVPFVLALGGDGGELRLKLLTKLFKAQVHDYTPAVRREHERQRHRLEFMSRKHLPELDEGHYVIRETITAELREGDRSSPIHGEIGLRAAGRRDSWIRLLCEGCLVQEVALDGPVPGLCAVVHAELTPYHSYDSVQADSSLAAALVAVLEGLARMVVGLAVTVTAIPELRPIREFLRTYVQQVTQPDYAVAVLLQFGFSRSHARRELKRLLDSEESSIRPRWRLDAPALDRHALANVPLYDRVGAGPCSLAELQARCAEGKRIAWLEAGTTTLAPLDAEVMLLDQADRAVLRALLGANALEAFAEQLALIERRAAFLGRPKATLGFPQTTGEALVRTSLNCAGVRGELGLCSFSASQAGDGSTPVRVFLHERKLCEFTLELPIPGLVAWVESADFQTTPSFEALAHPLELRRPLLAALVNLVGIELERAQRVPTALRRCEWWLLAMVPALVLGTGRLASAFLQLRQARGLAQALVDLDGLLGLLERLPERDLERALGRLRGRGELPTPEAVEAQHPRPTRPPIDAEKDLLILRRGLFEQLGAVLELPMIRRFTGPAVHGTTPRVLTLAALFDRVAAGEPISWVGEDFQLDAMPQLELEVVGLDPIEQRLVQNVVGPAGLELVREWLQGRVQFERRRTIDEIRVPRGAVLSAVEMSGEGWRGELGIARDQAQGQRNTIRVFTAKREVAVVDLPMTRVVLIGALEFDELECNERFDELSSADRERVRQIVANRTATVLRDLVARYREFQRSEKAAASVIVRHILVNWPPRTGGYAARAKQSPKLFQALAELPVFAGARKRWSAVELADADRRGSIATIAYRKNIELPDLPIVVLDAADVEPTLHALYGETRDLYAEFERTRELEARKAAAPRMPSQPPKSALARVEINEEQLQGWLWISPGQTEVMFGEGGRAVSTGSVSAHCACAGAIWGAGLDIASDGRRVILIRAKQRMLERRAVELWDGLLTEFMAMSEDRPPRSSAQRQRFASTRDALVGLFMRLRAALGRNKHNKRGNRYERLYARTYAAPLLELSTGRWISAEIAERERPIELAALELWTGPSAQELAHQRAVERREAEREAERQRERERDREREAELARRRVAAEAREREDQRRRELAREAKLQAEAKRAQPERQPAPAAVPTPRGPATPSPDELLLEALREELRLVRAGNRGLVSNRHLESLVLAPPTRRGFSSRPLFQHVGGRIEVDAGHPLFQATLAGYLDDQGLLTLLASAAYTYLNIIYVEIGDLDEAEFLRLHASHATTSIR